MPRKSGPPAAPPTGRAAPVTRTNQNGRAGLLALVAFGLFASHDAIIKNLGASYSPFQIVFFSVLFTFPLSTFYLMGDRTSATLLPRNPGWVLLRTVAAVFTAVSVFFAFSLLPLAQVYAILFATPLIITLLSIPLLGETVRLHRWLAIVVGLIGVVVTLRPGTTDLELGHAAALLAAFLGALSAIVMRKVGGGERALVLILYPLAANFVLMGCLLPMYYEPVPLEDLAKSAAAAALSFGGMLFTIAAYRIGSASVVAPMQYSQILWATVYGALFFGEALDSYTAVGAGIVIASGLYIVLRERSPGTSSFKPVLRTRPRMEAGTVVTASGAPENSEDDDRPDRPLRPR
ncbi:MAG: DMT family transporter [Acuticoccus sp.]